MSIDDPDDGEGFLTRWSRRKRERAEPVEVALPPPPSLPAVAPAETAPPEPEMVEPPSLDLVDKDFDVAHWLKQNVPESWKLAALRRAWESDPAIAGFENPARDYALDWNTPGGAPGYGPLTESDDVEAIVRGIFGDPPPSEEPAELVAEATGDSMPHELSSIDEGANRSAAVQQSALPGEGAGFVRLSETRPLDQETAQKQPDRQSDALAAAQNNPEPTLGAMRIRKRGGGAVPV